VTVTAALGADVIANANMVWPSWLSVNSFGRVSYDTTNIALGYWNYAVRISDPYSYIHIDFLIFIKEREQFCGCPEASKVACTGVNDCQACSNSTRSCDVNTAPYFVNPTPAAGSNTAIVMPGERATFQIAATDGNALDTVGLTLGSVAAGTTLSSVVAVNNSVSGVVQWTPQAGNAATIEVMCFWATDSHSAQSSQHCVKVTVVVNKYKPWPPAAPTLGVRSFNYLSIQWLMNPNMTTALTTSVTHYEIYSSFQLVYTTNGQALTYTHPYLTAGRLYNYTIRCCNHWGCGEHSKGGAFVTLSQPFNAPAEPYLIAATTTSLQVGWNEIYQPAGRYLYRWSLAIDGGTPILLANTTMNYTSLGLNPGRTYTFVVTACEDSGDGGGVSSMSCGTESNPSGFETLTLSASQCSVACPTVRQATTAALLGHWPLNEGTGGLFNAIGGSGNLSGAVVGASWSSGRHGKSLAFGTSGTDQASLEHTPPWSGFPSASMSICFWVRKGSQAAPSQGHPQVLISKSATTTSSPRYYHIWTYNPRFYSLLLGSYIESSHERTVSLPHPYARPVPLDAGI
jgi:hypothetical protein